MKSNKNRLTIVVALMMSFSVFSNEDPTWTAPPPTFDDDTADNTQPPASPINEEIAYLLVAGVLFAGYLTTKHKNIKSKNT